MLYVWCAAGLVVGLSFGFVVGMLVRSVHMHWEGVEVSAKLSRNWVVALFGGGFISGAPLFAILASSEGVVFYLLGGGCGLLLGVTGVFYPAPPFTVATVKRVVLLSDSLRATWPDAEARTQLIANVLLVPKRVQKELGQNSEQAAKALEAALDKAQPAADDDDDDKPDAGEG